MTPEEIKAVVEAAIERKEIFQWWHLVLWLFFTGMAAYLGTYLREKGKNVATKEDIDMITDKIEKVRSTYAKEIEEIRNKQQLRLAAIDRRLEAHQEAYALWRKLLSNVNQHDKIGEVVMECQEWWNNHCLYLAPKAREAFRYAYMCALSHKDYLQNRSEVESIKKNWDDILVAGQEIVKGAELPSLGEVEMKYLEEKEPNKPVEVTPTAT